MRWLCFSVMATVIACAGCSPPKSSEREQQRLAVKSPVQAAADRQIKNPFPAATEVRLFVDTGKANKKGERVFSKPHGLAMNTNQRARFESTIKIHKTQPEEMTTFCFIPHHFFRYYDRVGGVVGEIQVCFCCADVRQTGRSALQLAPDEKLSADYRALRGLIHSLGERTDIQCVENLK